MLYVTIFRWLTIMLRGGSVEAKKPDYSSFKAIWQISNTWILILFNLSLEHLPASRIQFSKILYTGKFLSKQCWDIILAPIQSRPDLSSNKEYVVHPTHIHPNVDICPLCVRHLWKKKKIPMVQINSIENGRISAATNATEEHTNYCNCTF